MRCLQQLAGGFMGVSGLLILAGCHGTSPTSSPPVTAAGTPKVSARVQAEVEDQLKGALDQLQLGNLGIDTQLNDAVSVLNNWWSVIKDSDLKPTGLTPPAIPADRVPAELLPRLERDTFDLEDGAYIHAAYVAHTIAGRLSDQSDRDLERVVLAFEWVCRNVTLAPEDEPLPPLAFSEFLMVGRGRPAERAWALAQILKQLKIDCVVLRPQQGGVTETILVGVPLDGEVYLFDPQLGLPLIRGDEPAGTHIRQPATLRELREHPDWLKALSARSDQAYELTVEQIGEMRVDAVTSPNSWAARMWMLEQMLPSEFLCVLYDAPAAIGSAPGVFERIAAAEPSWSADKINVWTYPLVRQVQMMSLGTSGDPNLLRLFQVTMQPFLAPLEARRDQETRVAEELEANRKYFGESLATPSRQTGQGGTIAPSMRHARARILQLQGHHADAVANFVTLRHLAVTPPPDPAWQSIYQRAAEDAFYWSCVCQYEIGEYELAAKSLADYLKRYRRGNWHGPAALLLAECQRELDHLPEAVQALKTATLDEGYRTTMAILARRWGEAKE